MIPSRAHSAASIVLFLSAVLLGLFSTGCQCGRDDKKPAEKPQPVEEKPKLPPNVDPSLLEALKTAALGCKVAEGQARIDCQGGDKNALVLSFNREQRKRVSSLPTFAYALTLPDENIKALAAAILYASFRTDLGADAKQGAVTSQVAQDLLQATLSLPDSAAMQAIPAATHAVMLSNQNQLLYDALEKDVPIQVKTMSYRYMMVYGRLPTFEKIREFGKDPGAAIVLSAIESPRNMPDWTKEEQEAICPWARTLLDDARPPVAGNAAAVLSNCAGEDLDMLLDRIAKVLKEKQFTFLHATALRDICGEAKKSRPEGASDAQCGRVRKLQADAARSKDLEGRVRAMTLSTLAHTWPDQQSLDIAKKLAADANAEVARAAQQIVTRLSSQLEATKKAR